MSGFCRWYGKDMEKDNFAGGRMRATERED